MPVIEGEKWACISCIKGHRVSGCNHHDRELHHINPKGRPVKQCEHCRVARKSKSHHTKCDCGEKKDKDKLKDKGDAKVPENRCCCHSGENCICGVKQDNLDLKLDTGKQTLHAARKPKLSQTHSESTLTVFANGHHQPCHRKNNTAHVSGAPYKIGRPHTLHGSAAFASLSQGNICGRSDAPAQRAMDTLSMSNNDFYTSFLGSGQRSIDSLPMTPLTGTFDTSGMQDSLFTSQSTSFAHDANSPSESQLSDGNPVQQWPWSNSVTPVNRNYGFGSLSTSPSQDCLPNLESDWAIPSAGLNNPSWSAGDLPLDPSKLRDTLTQPISHSGESNNPGLTTGSSSHSEVGEPVWFGDMETNNAASATTETLFWEDSPAFRFPTSAPSTEIRPAPTSMPAFVDNTQPTKAFTSVPVSMTGSNSSEMATSYTTADFSDASAIAMPSNIEDVVPNDFWSMDQNPNTMFNGANGFDMAFSNWI